MPVDADLAVPLSVRVATETAPAEAEGDQIQPAPNGFLRKPKRRRVTGGRRTSRALLVAGVRH